jgi:hypothetical protein
MGASMSAPTTFQIDRASVMRAAWADYNRLPARWFVKSRWQYCLSRAWASMKAEAATAARIPEPPLALTADERDWLAYHEAQVRNCDQTISHAWCSPGKQAHQEGLRRHHHEQIAVIRGNARARRQS